MIFYFNNLGARTRPESTTGITASQKPFVPIDKPHSQAAIRHYLKLICSSVLISTYPVPPSSQSFQATSLNLVRVQSPLMKEVASPIYRFFLTLEFVACLFPPA